MATLKFKEVSQYKVEKTPVPTEDHGYNKYD